MQWKGGKNGAAIHPAFAADAKNHPIEGCFVLFGEILIKKGDLIHYPLLLD